MITKENAEKIAKQYYNKVFSFCFSMAKSNYDDAMEITQEVFLLFAKKAKDLEDDKIEHWLIAVAKKKGLEYFRRIKKEASIIAIEDSFRSADEVFSTITRFYSYSDAEVKLTLDAILKMLTEEEYQLFVKKFIEKKTQAEIAKELNISISTVSTRTLRLRNKIEKLGFLCFTIVGQFIIKNIF